ncbi:unnamed protein product (macronuclear) [Paramecium tetraurelia]|uniref:EF-hand domain-containing protein n=1 Tax=Paramecium tetraurelia TaxID=5888 RepID=A0DUE6_PARTE|nr:uncharacterized protein GSPATT00020335001 [Paramecium tetraurelia]CAK86663.1 unnamed protein product [Paramecium tetraurelia]|eukprot:XP_001454060.1 hypothetical protein (macronuclear) [Paramecium tetraurelia strain d4-2]
MDQQIALYLKMISYYEQKLQTIKQTLYSNNSDNIDRSFELLSNNEDTITKNTLLNFFVQNLHPINYKDVIEFIWFIGDKDRFTISKQQFQNYLTKLLLHKSNTIIDHTNNDLQVQLLKLLTQQIRVIKQIKDSKLQIINNDEFNIIKIFQNLSDHNDIINTNSLLNFMKSNKVQFNNFDFDLLTFATFGRKCNITFDQFKDCSLFSNNISNKQYIKSREIPEEKQMTHSYIVNLSKSIIQQQQLMPISEASSIVEFKTSELKPKTKRYQEQTNVPRQY